MCKNPAWLCVKCVHNHYSIQLETPQLSEVGSRLSPGNLETFALHKTKNQTQKHLGILGIPCSPLLSSWLTGTTQPGPNESRSEGSRALSSPNPVPAPALLSFPSQQSSSSHWIFIPHPACCYLQSLCCQECKFLSFHQQNWEIFSHLPNYFLLSTFVLFSLVWIQGITSKLLHKRFLGKGFVLWLQEGLHWDILMEYPFFFPCFPPTCKSLRGFV